MVKDAFPPVKYQINFSQRTILYSFFYVSQAIDFIKETFHRKFLSQNDRIIKVFMCKV